MNKQLKLANNIITKAIGSRQTSLNIADYETYEVPARVFEMT